MAGLSHRCHRLLHHRRTHGPVLGLPRVYDHRIQTGDRTPARGTVLHAHRQPVLTVCQRPHTGGLYGEHHERTAQRGVHHVPVLDHHPPRPQTHPARLERTDHLETHCHRGFRTGGRTHLYLQRHILVQRCGERGLRLFVGLHGRGVLAHPEMGRRGRPAA